MVWFHYINQTLYLDKVKYSGMAGILMHDPGDQEIIGHSWSNYWLRRDGIYPLVSYICGYLWASLQG